MDLRTRPAIVKPAYSPNSPSSSTRGSSSSFTRRNAEGDPGDIVMPEKDGQLANDYVIAILKDAKGNIVNLSNWLSFRKTAFGGKYIDVNENALVEAWTNLLSRQLCKVG